MTLAPSRMQFAPKSPRPADPPFSAAAGSRTIGRMVARLLSTTSGRWVLFLLGWAGLSLLFAPEAYLSFYVRGQPIEWAQTLKLTVANAAIALVFLPGIVLLTRRFPVERKNWRIALLVHIPACVAFSLGHSGLYWVACYAYHEVGGTLFNRFHPNLLTYAAVVGFTQALDYFRKYQHREREFRQLQLEVLKAQLQPHFLFNTLNTIAAMVHEDVRAADRMIQRLGDLLRMTLANIGKDEIALADEIEFLRAYLEVERVRFGERLSSSIDVSAEAMSAMVPALFLQPLVENSIRHGLAARQHDGLIRIGAVRSGDWLLITVVDNGAGLAGSRPPREGVGLSNTRKRLQQLYPEDHAFSIAPGESGGVVVSAKIPFRTERDPEEQVSDEHPDTDRRRRAMGPSQNPLAPWP
jgi:two-component system, LytTR family, sensor kinase